MWQFTGIVARQSSNEQQWPWHEYGIDSLPELVSQFGNAQTRRHDDRGNPGDAGLGPLIGLAHKERPVYDTRNGIQLVIQIRQRAAFAGDVDQVRQASVQQESVRTGNL